MKSSHNTVRAAVESATQREKDLEALRLAKLQESERLSDPKLKAVTTQIDSKTLTLKFNKK